MEGFLLFQALLISLILLIDWYCFQAVKSLTSVSISSRKKLIIQIYWGFTIFTILVFLSANIIPFFKWAPYIRNPLFGLITMVYVSKLMIVLFLLIDDIIRLVKWTYGFLPDIFHRSVSPDYPDKKGISRSQFLVTSGTVVSLLPFATMFYGMTRGGYNYEYIEKNIRIPGFPKAFEGLRIVQISDLHAGSITRAGAISEVIEKVNSYKPDAIFFTGDIVNHLASELDRFVPYLRQLSAPMGIYSVLGNHDYGEYIRWDSEEEEEENFRGIIEKQEQMGWKVLRDENQLLEKNGEKIAIAGVENWSAVGNFQRYGDLKKALQGTEDVGAILLLSHDPSHWDGQILKDFPQVGMTFSGHTHGWQFGSSNPAFRWSPVQYIYKYWMGHYQVGNQQLYVNRGLGFTAFSGRVGMSPEVTIFDFYG